ncbi:MAG: hypothetical protein ACRDTC_04375 [Pseudonocardiaceae bacterium]
MATDAAHVANQTGSLAYEATLPAAPDTGEETVLDDDPDSPYGPWLDEKWIARGEAQSRMVLGTITAPHVLKTRQQVPMETRLRRINRGAGF